MDTLLPAQIDAATEASRQARRDRLTRIAKVGGMRAIVLYVCCAITAVCAVIAFVAGSKAGGKLLGFESLIALCIIYYSVAAGRRRAQDELKEMDRAKR